MQQHEDTIICILDDGGWSVSQKVQQASERGWEYEHTRQKGVKDW